MKRIIVVVFMFISALNLAQKNDKSQKNSHESFIKSIEKYKLVPMDTLFTVEGLPLSEKYQIGEHIIEFSMSNDFTINWLKINSEDINTNKLKTINPRTDGEIENMFCNYLTKIKLYKFKEEEIILLTFSSFPCTGLGCSVSDHLIYNTSKKKVNLFGNFRSENIDLYDFPINDRLNYIATEFSGDFHGKTPMHFVNRIYSMDDKGDFQLSKDSRNRELYYEIIIYPNETNKGFDYRYNWF